MCVYLCVCVCVCVCLTIFLMAALECSAAVAISSRDSAERHDGHMKPSREKQTVSVSILYLY